MKKSNDREPLFHITKRDAMPAWKGWAIRGIAVLVALIVSGLLIFVLTKYNPVKVYVEMFKGTFGSQRKMLNTFQDLAMLLCISLAVTPAFKMKFWNTGAEGQVLMGALAAFACMKYLANLPNKVLIPIMFVAGMLGGMVWGLIPAIFKSLWNTNETLFTLMMNYIAMQIITFFVSIWAPNGSGVVGVQNMLTKQGWIPDLFGQKYVINIIIVTVITILVYVYLKFSKQGYEISVVGESENTAKYIGIDVKKVILRTMAISGAICGIAGFLLVSGASHTINKDLAGGMGFTAILVSWLAKFNPITMVFTTFLIVFLQRGSSNIATACNLNESIADIVIGIILFCIIGSEFFINYKLNFRGFGKKEVK